MSFKINIYFKTATIINSKKTKQCLQKLLMTLLNHLKLLRPNLILLSNLKTF